MVVVVDLEEVEGGVVDARGEVGALNGVLHDQGGGVGPLRGVPGLDPPAGDHGFGGVEASDEVEEH